MGFLIFFLLTGRTPAVYTRVFAIAANLDRCGSWTRARELPGAGIPDGDPPSGITASLALLNACGFARRPAVPVLAILRPGTAHC